MNVCWNLEEIETCDSTNLEVKRRLQTGKANVGTVLSANWQSAGRGRLDRKWESPKGNVALTFVAPTPHDIPSVYQLNLIMALSLVRTINQELNLDCKIKWPNDILIYDLKVAGILSELYDKEKCLIGVGINANSTSDDFPENLRPHLTTLYDQLKKKINVVVLIKKIMTQSSTDFENYFKSGFGNFLAQIHDHLAWLGKAVQITEQENQPYSAKILRLDENGFLEVTTHKGDIRKILAGDVRLEKN